MKEKFLDFTINFLKQNNTYSDNEIKKLRYGLEGIYLTITKTIVILIIALLLNFLKEIIILLLLFNIIRYFSFGFHAEKSSECLILSMFDFLVIPYIFLKLNTSLFVNLIICGICLVLLLIFAPADTPKRPLKNKKKRIIRKLLTFIVGAIYTFLVITFKNNYVSQLLVCCLIITTIVVNPLTYWLFGQTYNNYKKSN